MIRGLYTGALGMLAREHETDVIANNLANVSTAGFRRDSVVERSFPEHLIRRFDDEVIVTVAGDLDPAPPVGPMGTGVQVDDIVTDRTRGGLRETSDPLDIALEGPADAFLAVQTPRGERYTRAGNLTISPEGFLVIENTGDLVLGENGPIRGARENLRILSDGLVETNGAYAGGLNRWEAPAPVDRLRLRVFADPDALEKEGALLYRAGAGAGPAPAPAGQVAVRTGFLEASNANVVREMVDLITAQRSYEANARVVQNYDQLLGQINQTARA